MQNALDICFPQGTWAVGHFLENEAELQTVLALWGFTEPRSVIVVIGGASGLQHDHVSRLRSLFVKVLAPLAETLNAAVVDGGTDAGVMRMMGLARSKTRATFPLIGVAPIGVVTLPGGEAPHADAAPLEPYHSHFLLVPGNQWGDESNWIAKVASSIARGAPTVTVLINGGEITWKDADESVKAGRPIVAIAGTGRAADTLVAALDGKVTDERAKKILASGLLQSVSIESTGGLEDAVEDILRNNARFIPPHSIA